MLKSYLVLEFAGYNSLTQFIHDKKQEMEVVNLRTTDQPKSAQSSSTQTQLLSEDVIRSIMRQLF